MTTRPETTAWARDAARRAHASIAREISRDTIFSPDSLRRYLELGESARLTLAETLSVVERAVAENRRPDQELEYLAAREQEGLVREMTERLAHAKRVASGEADRG